MAKGHNLLLGIVATTLLGAPLFAQSPSFTTSTDPAKAEYVSALNTSTDDNQSVITIRKRVDEVNVVFSATDKHGKFVRDLKQNDFSFFDDHNPVEAIVNFRRDTDLPLQLGLLV